MHKSALVVLAAMSLSACASLSPMHEAALSVAKSGPKAAMADVVTPAAPIVVTHHAMDAQPEAVATAASAVLSRRAFSPPTRHQPELGLVLATAIDRARFYRRRRVRRRCA